MRDNNARWERMKSKPCKRIWMINRSTFRGGRLRTIMERCTARLIRTMETGRRTLGWIKRGPSGIVGTNCGDAKDTVATVLKCLESGAISNSGNMGRNKPGRKYLTRHLSSGEVRAVSWNDFWRIDEAERDAERLRSEDQPREKCLYVNDMLRAIKTEERITMPTR